MFCNNTSGIPEAKIPVIIYIWSDLEPRELKGQVIFKVCLTEKKKKRRRRRRRRSKTKQLQSIQHSLKPSDQNLLDWAQDGTGT